MCDLASWITVFREEAWLAQAPVRDKRTISHNPPLGSCVVSPTARGRRETDTKYLYLPLRVIGYETEPEEHLTEGRTCQWLYHPAGIFLGPICPLCRAWSHSRWP
ncbi:hypothetical protein CBL_00713 [Carabus blaptoides fortunei]